MTMQTKTDRTYQVADIRIATLLRLKGFKLINVEHERSGRGIFIFEDRADREQLVLSFINREERLDVIGFLDEMKNLKGLVRS